MKSTAEILQVLRAFKETRGKKYGIEKLGIFGSTARSEQNEDSDIDVCMKTHESIDFFTLEDIREELEKVFATKIDLLTLHNNMRPSFRKNIERDAIFV